MLTLVVVPALYALIARNTSSPHHVSDMIEKLVRKTSAAGTPSATGTTGVTS
jgi:hypothetical protein